MDETTLRVKFVYSIFENANGYSVNLYENFESKERIKCTGYFLPQIKDLTYEIKGKWKNVENYGLNFQISSYKEIIENTRSSIVAYLSSILSGVGKKTADRIYDTFGNDSLFILENEPEQLLSVKGITKKKLEKIETSYKEKYILRELTEFLLPYGITPKQTLNLYTAKNVKTKDEFLRNPYIMCDIHGIKIQTIDMIARNFGYPEDGKERLIAHTLHVLYENEALGSTGMEVNDFGKKLLLSLGTKYYTKQNICGYTIQMIKDGILTYRKMYDENGILKTIIFRPAVLKAEEKIAEKVWALMNTAQMKHENCENEIQQYAKKNMLTFDYDQKKAITEAIKNSVTIITGGPGTGKTTIIKAIADYLSKYEDRNLYFMAPSGRAARHITESTSYPASTIHKGIRYRPGEDYFSKEDKVTFEDATIIVDEYSMVDTFLTNLLLECICVGCRLILVGDVNQLPSVGAGAVLRDMINSDCIPVVWLTCIHRQSFDSMTYINAQNIVRGIHDIKEGSDFKIINSNTPIDAQEKMISSYLQHVKREGIENVYCLCPCKEREAGVKVMNKILQEKVNPPTFSDKEYTAHGYTYRIGDPVMHLKNNIDNDISNGDIGYVSDIKIVDGEKTLYVMYFGDTLISYTKEDVDDFTLAYALTVHKAQGCENKVVITYLSRTLGKNMLKRNLLNTSITRGKNLVELYLTNDNAVDIAIDNDDSKNRITGLLYQFKRISGQFIAVS